jgi:hypothetical protein
MFIRVTHPFHPLRGRKFELVDRRQTWGEDRVYYQDGDQLKRMPSSWTSAAAPSLFRAISAGRALFQVEELLELATLIARQREAQRAPRRAKRRASRK